MVSTQYCYKNISFLIFISHKIKIYNDKRKQNPFTRNMTHPWNDLSLVPSNHQATHKAPMTTAPGIWCPLVVCMRIVLPKGTCT